LLNGDGCNLFVANILLNIILLYEIFHEIYEI
jgi:hypothetical protein